MCVRTGFFMAMVSAPCPPMECPQMPTVSAAICGPKLAAMTLGSSCRCPMGMYVHEEAWNVSKEVVNQSSQVKSISDQPTDRRTSVM